MRPHRDVRLDTGNVTPRCDPTSPDDKTSAQLPNQAAPFVDPMALTKGELIQFPPIWISAHAFADYFADPQWIASTATSLKVAALAVVGQQAMDVAAGDPAVGAHRAVMLAGAEF